MIKFIFDIILNPQSSKLSNHFSKPEKLQSNDKLIKFCIFLWLFDCAERYLLREKVMNYLLFLPKFSTTYTSPTK